MSLLNRLSWLLGFGDYGMERKVIRMNGQNVVREHRSGTLMRYHYRDGYVCEAYNLRQADKKHRTWWKRMCNIKSVRK